VRRSNLKTYFDLDYMKTWLYSFKLSREDIKFSFDLIFKPFSSFWDMKYEGKGKLNAAIYIMMLLVFVLILQKQYTGFIVNYFDPNQFNSFEELIFVLVPFFTFCISNWALTTLMDGEGKFKEIVMAAAYALMPMIIIYLLAMIISNFLTVDETAYYFSFTTIGSFWFFFLLFVGNMTVHQYTVTKTLVTMGLTLVFMFFIFFLAILFFSLVQQLIAFGSTIYQEIIFRT
jgi:hypothetical protein